MSKTEHKKSGGARKIGRNRRVITDHALSKYIKGEITFETYYKRTTNKS